jgi:hypothetical protein
MSRLYVRQRADVNDGPRRPADGDGPASNVARIAHREHVPCPDNRQIGGLTVLGIVHGVRPSQ